MLHGVVEHGEHSSMKRACSGVCSRSSSKLSSSMPLRKREGIPCNARFQYAGRWRYESDSDGVAWMERGRIVSGRIGSVCYKSDRRGHQSDRGENELYREAQMDGDTGSGGNFWLRSMGCRIESTRGVVAQGSSLKVSREIGHAAGSGAGGQNC